MVHYLVSVLLFAHCQGMVSLGLAQWEVAGSPVIPKHHAAVRTQLLVELLGFLHTLLFKHDVGLVLLLIAAMVSRGSHTGAVFFGGGRPLGHVQEILIRFEGLLHPHVLQFVLVVLVDVATHSVRVPALCVLVATTSLAAHSGVRLARLLR